MTDTPKTLMEAVKYYADHKVCFKTMLDRGGAFTMKQLDALAPLSEDDCECLRAFYTPRCETIERLNKRILAAREIKYGVK